MDLTTISNILAKIPHSRTCVSHSGRHYVRDPLPTDRQVERVNGWYGLACTCNREQRIAVLFVRLVNMVQKFCNCNLAEVVDDHVLEILEE